MFMALLSSWDSQVLIFPKFGRRKAEVASSQSCCPKRRNNTYMIPFPNLFPLKPPKRSLQSAFSTLSSGSWHFPSKQYPCSTLEMYISFSSREVCACQQDKIPAHTKLPLQRKMVLKTEGDSGQILLLANGMGEVEMLLAVQPSGLTGEAAQVMYSDFCVNSRRSPVN